jgi:hypothetical protein
MPLVMLEYNNPNDSCQISSSTNGSLSNAIALTDGGSCYDSTIIEEQIVNNFGGKYVFRSLDNAVESPQR